MFMEASCSPRVSRVAENVSKVSPSCFQDVDGERFSAKVDPDHSSTKQNACLNGGETEAVSAEMHLQCGSNAKCRPSFELSSRNRISQMRQGRNVGNAKLSKFGGSSKRSASSTQLDAAHRKTAPAFCKSRSLSEFQVAM